MTVNVDAHFTLADLYVGHLRANAAVAADPFIASRHVGFVAVSAVTVYELAVKDVFISFGWKKHRVLGCFVESRFDRINGRVSYSSICNEYIKLFGDKYLKRFKRRMNRIDNAAIKAKRGSIINAYNNVIAWRNEFAHGGHVPAYVTLAEVMQGYEEGKDVIRCLADCMTR
jgi:hypothetical protein